MKPSELIRRYGWVQGRLGDTTDGFCLLESVYRGLPSRVARDDAYHRITARCGTYPVLWNDAPGRTKKDVLALLEGEGL